MPLCPEPTRVTPDAGVHVGPPAESRQWPAVERVVERGPIHRAA
jgi:hypothetical protein